ncbi:MAG: hypothetical protein M0R76_11390 [Proteobacteria bacterium]|jgi:hypothetical protein|nr:hypothetical protein [Pseudomonadota bacterium]NLN61893.1 hypothetical protein [Myxococcales bacterium]
MTHNALTQPLAIDEVLALEGMRLDVLVAQPRPPGARVSMQLALAEKTLVLHGKVVGQERLSPTALRMSVRLSNLPRQDRALLQQHLDSDAAPPG